jgi:putative methyltransferase (TIGR04325 family)
MPNFRDLIPPLVHRMRHPPHREVSTYEEAVKACGAGYDSARLAEIVRKKTETWFLTDEWKNDASAVRLATAIGIARQGGTLNVLDFGGAAAGHYSIARKIFTPGLLLRWHVIETPAMVRECRSMESESLRFFSDRDEAVAAFSSHGGPGLLFSSGTLPYLADPQETLRWMLAQECPHLALVRCELSNRPSNVFAIQSSRLSYNGPGPLPLGYEDTSISYPITLLDRSKLEALILKKYELVVSTAEPVHFFDRTPGMFSYYCRRRGFIF